MKKEIVFETFAIKRSRVTSRIWRAPSGAQHAAQHFQHPVHSTAKRPKPKALYGFTLYILPAKTSFTFLHDDCVWDGFIYGYEFEVSL